MFVKGNLVRCKTSGVIGYVIDIYSRQYPNTIRNFIPSRNGKCYQIKTYRPHPFAKQIMIIDIKTGKDYHAPYEQWEQHADIEEVLL